MIIRVIIRSTPLICSFAVVLFGVAGLCLMAVLLSLLPIPSGFWLESDPFMWIAVYAPYGRISLGITVAALYLIGCTILYVRVRFEMSCRAG